MSRFGGGMKRFLGGGWDGSWPVSVRENSWYSYWRAWALSARFTGLGGSSEYCHAVRC